MLQMSGKRVPIVNALSDLIGRHLVVKPITTVSMPYLTREHGVSEEQCLWARSCSHQLTCFCSDVWIHARSCRINAKTVEPSASASRHCRFRLSVLAITSANLVGVGITCWCYTLPMLRSQEQLEMPAVAHPQRLAQLDALPAASATRPGSSKL